MSTKNIVFLNNEQIDVDTLPKKKKDVDINFNDITNSFLFGKCSRRSRS